MLKKVNIGDTVWVYEPWDQEEGIYSGKVLAVDNKGNVAMVKISDFFYDSYTFKHLFKTRKAVFNYAIRSEEKCALDHKRDADRLRKMEKEDEPCMTGFDDSNFIDGGI